MLSFGIEAATSSVFREKSTRQRSGTPRVNTLIPKLDNRFCAVERLCHRVTRRLTTKCCRPVPKQFVREMDNVHPDIVSLVGRLKFRLSYSQNQLLHAVEVARLSGPRQGDGLKCKRRNAWRLTARHWKGHDPRPRRLPRFLERRSQGVAEAEVIANAIGSHHSEPMNSPIAYIVTAADALSGARPGVRRETASLYLARMQQLSDIAHGSTGVLNRLISCMLAGRSVWLFLVPSAWSAKSRRKPLRRYIHD